jgi:hypothetical protein
VSWVNAIADHLTSNSLGTQGTDLFIGQMTDTTVLTTLLTEYDGSFMETFASGMAISQPSLQVRVRGAIDDYVTPRARLVAIQTLLNSISNQTLGGVQFLRVRPSSTILSMGQDDRLRWEFSANFEVTFAGI